MTYDPFKHHRQTTRLKGFDYSMPGLYFITICTKNREYLFGDIKNGKMILNEFGEIAKHELLKSSNIRKELEIDCFVIMPNHVHAIVAIVGASGWTPFT